MSTMKTKKTFGLVFAALLVISLYFSCEVGLGSAVDVQAPEITIEKPEVDMVIRQKFIISGTWSDDGIIDNVYIKLKRTDGRAVDGKSKKELDIPGSFEVSPVDKELGTWKAEIDPLDDATPIVDGTYQATVVIKDKGKHTTTQSTTFTIDNTAPVLILTKPNSTPGDKTVSAYGQRLFLEGSIADSTKDTWVEINFYSDEECTPETLLTTLETGLIAPTDVNSNNAKLAVFNADLTKELAEEYKAIYGQTTKNGPRTIYSKITVYDTAETCTETDQDQPTGKNGKIKGNASQSFYFSKLLAESITKSQDANGYGLAPIDIYNVLNGTYSLKNEARSGIVSSVKDKLENSNLKKDKTVFTINPENSPYFTVSGLKTLNLDGKDFEEGNTIVNGTQTLEISVFMGSDSIALKDDENFYVYLLECDNYGVPLDQEDNESSRIKLYSKYDETGSGANKKIYYEIGGKTDHKTTSGAYVFSVPMSKSIKANPDLGEQGFAEIPLEFGHNYIIRVSGTDTEDNQIETTDTGYGFRFTAGGVAPIATITQPKDTTVWIKKGDGLKVTGTVKSEEGQPHFMAMNGNIKLLEFDLTPTAESGVYSFDDIIPASAFDQDESIVYSLEFLATRDETKSTYPKSVWYDVEGPEITMGDPSPLVRAGSSTTVTKDSINGVITLSGSIVDKFDQFKSATYRVEQDGAVVDKPGLSGELTSNFTFTLDTTLLTDTKDASIIITATDRAGNTSEEAFTYYVDQKTDIPEIISTDKDITKGITPEGLTYVDNGNNLFVRAGNLVLSVGDDDGVQSAHVTVQALLNKNNINSEDSYESVTSGGFDPKQNQDYPLPSVISHTLPNSVGIYRATVKVYDKNYTSEAATPYNYKTIQFFIRVTGTGPDVSITPDREYIKTGGTYTLTFDITDEGNKPYKLKLGNDVIREDIDVDEFTYDLTNLQPTTDTEAKTLKFTIIDKNASFTEKNFTPRFDDSVPTLAITDWPKDMNSTGENSYLFKGTATDTPSGVDKVEIKFIDAANNKETEWAECSLGLRGWNYEAKWSGDGVSEEFANVFAAENTKTVKVRAVDGAGNETTAQETFVYDKQAPVVSAVLKDAATNTETDTNNGKNDVKVEITITDTNPKKVEVKVLGKTGIPIGDTITVTSFSGSGNEKTATARIPKDKFNTDEDYTIKIQGFDDNDRSSITVTKTIKRDTTIPTVTIVDPESDIVWANAHTGNSYTFKVSVYDRGGSGVQSVSYALVQQDTAPAPGNPSYTPVSFTGGETLIQIDSLEEGPWYFYVYATDKAGNNIDNNRDKIQKRLLSVDKNPPSLTITSPANLLEGKQNIISDEVGDTGFELKGSVSDTNLLATTDPFVITVDGVEQTVTRNGVNYTCVIPKSALKENDSVEVILTAKDICGKTTTKSFFLYYDTQAPELAVTAPAATEPVETATKAIKGTVSDNGYGVDKVEYWLYSGHIDDSNVADAEQIKVEIDNIEKPVNSTNFPVDIKGEQWYIKRTDTTVESLKNVIPLGTTQGELTLKVTATEKTNGTHGGRTSTEYVSFYYDKANPELEENVIKPAGKTTNETFTLGGKVWDTYELSKIEIKCGTQTWVSGTDSNISLTKKTSDPGENQTNWSASFVVGSSNSSAGNYIADGTKEFTIIATDKSGKTKQLTRTVVVDTQKPTVDEVSINSTTGENIGGVLWYTTTSIPIEVQVTEKGLSGISKVEYKVGTGAWTPLSFTNNKYQGTISFAEDGAQSFKIKATDVAGNESDETTTNVNIDITKPNLTALYYKTDTGTAKAIENIIYVKDSTKITVYGNYDDLQSGVKALAFTYGDEDNDGNDDTLTPTTLKYSTTAIGTSAPSDTSYTITSLTGKETTVKSWMAEFTPSVSSKLTVSGENRTKNPTGTLKVFDVTVDGDKPVVDNVKLIEVTPGNENQAYSDGSKYFVNNKTTGKTFKISGVATDTVGVDSVALLITKNGTSTTKTATRKGSLGQWYFEGIDLSAWDGTGASVKLTVKDKAGNEADENVEFDIAFDVTAPATIHLIDDSLKNLEFRIGDAPNDAGESDVGSKYSNGAYGSSLTMQLRGNFPDEENGSGINKFYYKTFNNEEVKIDSTIATGTTPVHGTGTNEGKIFFKDDAALIAYVIANKTDVFSPIAEETRNVEYNIGPYTPETWVEVPAASIRFGGSATTTANASGQYKSNKKGYVQFRTKVSTNFKTTIKGFNEGKNYLVIVAEDNAGNIGLDTAKVEGVEYPCYSLNVDITAPTIPQKHEDAVYTNVISTDNTTQKVEISGTVSDAPNKDDNGNYISHGSSGIKEIVFTSDQNNSSVTLSGESLGLTSDAIAADPSPKAWTVDVRPLLSTNGTAIISAKVTDNAGFSTSVPVANITVDRTPPSLAITSSITSPNTSPITNEEEDTIVGITFTMKGTASDGNGAGLSSENMVLYYSTTEPQKENNVYKKPTSSTGWTQIATFTSAADWKKENIDLSEIIVDDEGNPIEDNTTLYFTVAGKDNSGTGNTGYAVPVKVIVDTKKPALSTVTVGDKTDSQIDSSWFKEQSLSVSGTFTDDGSRVKTIKYKVGENGTVKSLATSDGTFDTNVTGFALGQNTLYLWAEDNVGNKTEEEPRTYTIKIDKTSPTITAQSQGIQYSNGGTYPVSLTVSDDASGVASVALTSDVKTGTVNCILKNGKYTAENISTLLPESGNATITATATDAAGNTSSKPIASIMIDKEAPVVSITSPADANKDESDGIQINRTISLSGTAQDTAGGSGLKEEANGSKTLKLYYTTNATLGAKDGSTEQKTIVATDIKSTNSDTDATKFVEIKTLENTFAWNFADIDTTKLDGTNATSGTVYLMASTQDKAGNTGYSVPLAVVIDQDSDRPIVTLTNLVLATEQGATSYLKGTSRLEGTISDDDGSVQKMEYSKDGTNYIEITLQYGSAWSIAGLSEGENTIYFRVKDAKDKSFTTLATDKPKIKDTANGTSVSDTSALAFKVVTKAPDVQNRTYSVYNSNTSKWEDRTSIGTLGGIYTKFKIALEAKSASFVGSVKAEYNDVDYEFSCSVAHNDANYHTWESGEIIVVNGKTDVKLTIADASSTEDPMTTEQTFEISIDNTAPTIRIKEPSSTVGVKETMQFDMSEAATAYYAVTRKYKLNDQGVETTTECTAEDVAEWTLIQDTSNGLVRYVHFDDDLNETDHTDRFALYLTESTEEKPNRLGITTKAEIERTNDPYETITPVKFWVKAVDSCGNTATKDQLVNVDPQGNRPTVTLGYPVNVLKDGNYVAPTLGGTIRLDGNVSDDIAAKYVWVKIEREGAAFSGADVKFLKTSGYSIGDMTTNELLADATITALADNANVPNYAIRVPVTGTSWNLSINGDQEFNIDDDEAHLKFRIYATDADQDKVDPNIKHIHRSAEITQDIVIDSRTPYISASDLRLVKYNGNTEAASKEYKDGTSVQEIWYLVGKIKDDDSGIRTISFKRNSAATYTDVITTAGQEQTDYTGDAHFYFTKIAHADDTNKFDYNFSIPLGNETAGEVGTDTITIKAVEATGQNLQVEQTYTVTYDNKAPEFNTDTENAFVKLSTNIYNSSGFYTFGAIASEDKVTVGEVDVSQSGVERIAFYFTRDLSYSLSSLDAATYTEHTGEKGSKTNDLFDVMIYHSNGDAADVASGNMIVNYKGKTDNSLLSYSEGLYWRTHSGSASGSSFTYTGDVDPNIHAGGLVKINGVIYTIASVSDKTVTVSSNIGTASSAAFALCNVIDKSGEKNGTSIESAHGYGYGYYLPRTTDDGDLITETFNNQGTEWIFDASINSKNLPDGPITLHMVAFDKAGNVTEPFTMTGTVKNNAPRIAGLILGTDENGNGSVDEGEFIKSYTNKFNKGYDDSMNEMHDVSFPIKVTGQAQTSLLTVKGLTVVKPEIIGGNGAISYSYEVYPYNKSEGTWPDTTTITNAGGALKDASGTGISGTTDDVVTGQITLPVSDFIGTTTNQDTGAIPDGTLSKFLFKFGDSTPGTSATDVTGKNTATMAVYMDVALRETNKAKNWILPFYWNSKTDNSLFKQSADEGHIELAEDWVTTTSYRPYTENDTVDTIHLYDQDPKVSGRIKIEGIAQDDTLLSAIYVKFGKKVGGNSGFTADTDKAIATYNAAGASWTVTALTNGAIDTTTGWASAIQQATYQDLLDAGIIDALPDNTEATAKVPYTSQDYGHVVHWILYLDTAQVDDVAATDVTVTATATDRGKPKWNGTGVGYTPNTAAVTVTDNNDSFSGAVTKSDSGVSIADLTGKYRVDVVPYITKIGTSLDGAYKSNTSVFNRSALGSYPVRRGETITVTGFNLKKGDTAPAVNIGTTTATLSDDQQAASTASSFAVNIPNTAKTGDLEVTVNSVVSLNNKTIKTVEYNQEPNGINNDILTNARRLSVWKFASVLTNNNTTIRYPSMRVGKDANQTVGFVYDSGAQAVKMNQSGDDYLIDWSFTQWYATSVAVDNAGRMYGSGMNGDSGGSGNQSWKSGGYANYGFYAWNTKNYPGRIRDPYGDYANPGSGTYLNHQAYSSGRKKVALENSSADENGNNFSATRVMNPKIVATSGTGTDSTGYVYTAYYDSIFDRVVFRYGTVSGTMNSNNNSLTFGGGLGNHGNTNNGSAANLQIIAGTGASGTNSIDGGTATANTSRSGEYVAVGVIPKAKIAADATVDGAVVAWYDASNQRLLFSYNKNPTSTANAANWGTNTQIIDSDFAGWYVDMAVDADGNVHIAYYGASNGDLKYAYLPIAKDANGNLYTQGAQVCTVDSYLSVGTNISIDVPTAKETVYKADGTTTTRYVPRISYFMSAFTKTKYSVRTASLYKLGANDVITDGAEDDKFTGNWEVMSIPTNQIPLDYTIGVGIKKNDSNVNSTLLGYGTTTNLQTAALQ